MPMLFKVHYQKNICFLSFHQNFKVYLSIKKTKLTEIKYLANHNNSCTGLFKAYLSVSMEEDANFCRNPDYSSKPWCYVQGEIGPEKGYCDIPSCGQYILNEKHG